MMIIVDGTGEKDDAKYGKEMEAGFCRRIHLQMGARRSTYLRGPTLWGEETAGIAMAVGSLIAAVPADEPVYLAGHSRGGAAVIWAAKSARRQVEAMFLFDAVERARNVDCDVITNTKRVYHALRDPAFSERFEAQRNKAALGLAVAAVVPTAILGFPAVKAGVDFAGAMKRDLHHKWGRSRTFFGNAGRRKDPPLDNHSKSFMCTHGAVGGVPWKDVDGDEAVAREVWTWIAGHMLVEGLFGIQVKV